MHKIVYMEWVKTRPRAKYEIGGSGVIPVQVEELPEARAALKINDFNLYGYRPLLQAIADRYEVAPNQVVTAPGTSMANYLAIAAIVRPGDEVLVESPAYEPLLAIPRLLGCQVRRFDRPWSRQFGFDLAGLSSQITDRTKLIILTNLHNPSGRWASLEELAALGDIARQKGAFVLVDEVYMDFLFERRPKSSVHLGSNFLMTCSLTKVYGFDGLRCGWILANPEVAKTMWRLQDFFGVNGVIPGETTSLAAFEHLDRFVARTRAILATNRPIVEQFLENHRDQLEWYAPDAGPVWFPRLRAGSAESFCDRLRSQYDVGVIPGHFFEMPDHFRLGFGGPTAELQSGLERLSAALRAAT